jgi:predicted GTPase
MVRDRIGTAITATAIIAASAIPLLALIPLGWLWIWQNGYVLPWLAGTLVVSVIAIGLRFWLMRRLAPPTVPRKAEAVGTAPPADAVSPREAAARDAVERLAETIDPATVSDREALTNIGIETVEAVARHMHPGVEKPVWAFTVPEALTLIERISQRLRPLVVENVPLGDRLTVGQVMRLYEWRKVIDIASSAYDIWRVIRIMNPIAAATQEIRERLSKTMMEGLRQELAKRLLATYVREVGRAAIDLYSGRLAVPAAESASSGGTAGSGTVDSAAPLRLLIAGRTGSGKSSLVNAMAEEVQAPTDVLPQTHASVGYEVQRPGMPPVLLLDNAGLTQHEDIATLVNEAAKCDLLIWVASADRPDRALDRLALDAIRQKGIADPDRPAPPVLVVLSHVDRLRPFREWSPPYDIARPDGAKARSIREAMDAAAGDLARPLDTIVPVCLSPERGTYNADIVWARVAEALPEAKRTQLVRRIASARKGMDWRRLLGQAVGAGRLAADVVMGSRKG